MALSLDTKLTFFYTGSPFDGVSALVYTSSKKSRRGVRGLEEFSSSEEPQKSYRR